MKKPGLRTTTGLLLSAAMVLGGIVPPGQRHAHEGGDVAHEHGQPQSIDSHDCHHHHAADQSGLKVEVVKPAAIAHVHIALWLFDLTLPVRDESETQDEGPDQFVRLMDDCLPISISGSMTQAMDVSAPLSGIAIAPAKSTAGAANLPSRAILLCDAARHERSGVQLF